MLFWSNVLLHKISIMFKQTLFHAFPAGVALVLCQSDPVLNDGLGGDSSREAVIEGVRRQFIEKVVREHEDDDDDGSSSD